MAITSYVELQAAVANWLGRADLTARIPEFIALAESKMRRVLRDKTTVAAATLGAGTPTLALGTNVKELISIRYNTGTYFYALIEKTLGALADLRQAGTGRPTYFAVIGNVMYFDVTPDSGYTMEIVYVEKIVALATTSPSTTLTASPDIYLYGALCEAETYLEHDERLATWQTLFAQAVQDENNYRERGELGAGAEAEFPVVFGECP